MKKSTLGILALAALAFTPMAAFADNQINVQSNQNSAVADGYNNVILQDADQNSYQTQVGVDGYGYGSGYDTPDSQLSIQGNVNSATAVGEYNVIDQNVEQDSYQTQVDVDGYFPY